MGGQGSGRRHRWDKGFTVEDGLTLDLNKLIRDGLVGPWSRRGTLSWTSGRSGERVASVGYEVMVRGDESISLVLAYTVGTGDSRHRVREAIRLQTTRPGCGGRRWWFTCPRCGRRVAKLYSPPHCDLFLCRPCCGLKYNSQRESNADRSLSQAQKIRMKLGGSPAIVDPFPPKPKRMHWRTYWRLREKAQLREQRSLDLLAQRLREVDPKNWAVM